MRGKGSVSVLQSAEIGITPAYAGKSFHECHRVIKSGDHPRLCGEKTGSQCSLEKKKGSPPPMRGKVTEAETVTKEDRITPAYAGKSRTLYAEAKNYEDHPRLCGEKHSGTLFPLVANRITPAYAGKRLLTLRQVHGLRDHPRLCGEKIQNWLACWQEVGSPPPMRGKVCTILGLDILYRITPAYAGKST